MYVYIYTGADPGGGKKISPQRGFKKSLNYQQKSSQERHSY